MQRVFEIFEQILSIPRSSGKEEKISDFIVAFAKEHNLYYNRDGYNNVFIRKDNNSDKTIILQAHSDMVCVSNNEYDFENKGIEFYIEDDYYKAKNTSLGADDGIGIAIILAILEEDNMPNIEVMITTQEETTMLGAINFDYKQLKGKTLISLDGIKEGDIESSSAGMCSIELKKDITYTESDLTNYNLTISKLAGGHSGDDIDKDRKNAIKLAFDIMHKLNVKNITSFGFGKKDNVIPSDGSVGFTSSKESDVLENIISNIDYKLSADDKKLEIKLEKTENNLAIKESSEIINFINTMEDGLLKQYEDGFPLLSSNLGTLDLVENKAIIKLSIRSSDIELENKQLQKIKNLCEKYGFEFNLISKKPFFPYSEKSNIRELLSKTYKELYNRNAITKKVHACMEGGIISSNIKGLDIVTIAPTISDCHSINEKVSISSTERVYQWLKETLKKYMIID